VLVACGGEVQSAESTPEVEPTATKVPSAPTVVPTPTSPTTTNTTNTIPAPDYGDILSMPSVAADTPEGTFELYLQDAIAQQISIQREKLDMRMRYQHPTTLLEDAGGLVLDVELLENRSRRTVLREKDATFEVEIDVRVTFADGDTSTQSCAWTVSLQKDDDELWYVVNPRELLLFINCA
jgi:hypothetical protein